MSVVNPRRTTRIPRRRHAGGRLERPGQASPPRSCAQRRARPGAPPGTRKEWSAPSTGTTEPAGRRGDVGRAAERVPGPLHHQRRQAGGRRQVELGQPGLLRPRPAGAAGRRARAPRRRRPPRRCGRRPGRRPTGRRPAADRSTARCSSTASQARSSVGGGGGHLAAGPPGLLDADHLDAVSRQPVGQRDQVGRSDAAARAVAEHERGPPVARSAGRTSTRASPTGVVRVRGSEQLRAASSAGPSAVRTRPRRAAARPARGRCCCTLLTSVATG